MPVESGEAVAGFLFGGRPVFIMKRPRCAPSDWVPLVEDKAAPFRWQERRGCTRAVLPVPLAGNYHF